MPRTDVLFYQEDLEDVPVLDWLKELRRSNQRAYESCVAAIGRLAEFGNELRRPLADFLRDGIYELRIRKGRVPTGAIEIAVRREEGFPGRPRCAHVSRGGQHIVMPHTKDALKILRNVTGNNEAVKAGIAQAKINFEVAQMIYDSRTKAGLSQKQLAALIGSKQPVIARLEDADYEGHSLTMLQRIAAALEQRLELRFVPQRKPAKRGRRLPTQPRRNLQPA